MVYCGLFRWRSRSLSGVVAIWQRKPPVSIFKNWTEAEVAFHNAKASAPRVVDLTGKGVDIESKLHEQIIAECRRRGWYYVHSRMDRRTTTALGVPDFIVAADGGRTFWIEAKARNRKLTREQAGAISWLTMLGHKSIVVHNLDGFIAAVT